MVGASLVVVALTVQLVTSQRRSFPARLDSYLTDVIKLSGNERQRLQNGIFPVQMSRYIA